MQDIQLKLTDPIGVEFTVTVPYEKLYDAMRYFGSRGCTSGEIPPGGLRLPMANEADFDWSLLGARQFTINDNGSEVQAVAHRGHIYKRRELAENKKFNMKPVVKYSRGAKNTDPLHMREGEEGATQYVTLIVFANDRAPKDDRYSLPST